ncbi:unnamed protein product [Moneuplotes crassus]|uniref:F-box domain-containing protein n=1 Tax=Euplotes crassus TaxID=5936 RepID=A0AAD2D4F5_EUPCR|nr:unnamed protein product [Moneuplotes crassus]
MEYAQLRPRFALDLTQLESLKEATQGKRFYNHRQVLVYLLRYMYTHAEAMKGYEEVIYKESDQMFSLKYVKSGGNDKTAIHVRGLSILNHLVLTVKSRGNSYEIPLNLDKTITIGRSSYTVNNEIDKTFTALFTDFDKMNVMLKNRCLDKLIRRTKVERIFDMRKELLVEIFKYLDFDSLKVILNSCSFFREEFWDKNEWFWFNLYCISFGKPPFKSSIWNWAQIYRNSITTRLVLDPFN